MNGLSTNWAGNYQYRAAHVHQPETIEQVQELVRRSRKIKALGTRHSFNAIADSAGDHISMEKLNRIVGLDQEHFTVTVEAGARYGELAHWLHGEGYALHNMASLPHISVAGACATATHGSGDQHGNLATAVVAMDVVTASGEVVQFAGDHVHAAAVHLGGLGIVTKLTLKISPTFQMQQDVYEHLPLARLEQDYDALTSSAYSVSLFTTWRSSSFDQVWLKRVVPDGLALKADRELFGASLATTHLHPIPPLSAEPCTEQMGICGPWHERMPHFRMGFTPSSGEELQTEYLIPRRYIFEALHEVDRLRERIAPLLQTSEVRTIAADELWMSPCYKQSCIGIHFTWIPDWEQVRELLPVLESRLERFEARPHWGKLFLTSAGRVQSLYEKLPDFRRMCQEYDPQGKFRNPFLDEYIFGSSGLDH